MKGPTNGAARLDRSELERARVHRESDPPPPSRPSPPRATARATRRSADLLVLDGGGSGKGSEPPVQVEDALAPGGTVVIDDFTPSNAWPPLHLGALDRSRLWWLDHPALLATEITLAPDLAAIVATRTRG